MRVLIIAAHPDDEILGVGGTICKHVNNGDKVFICVVTKAYEPIWTKQEMERKIIEQKKVDELLSITKRYNLDLPTIKLNTISSGEISNKISDVVNETNPNVIYTHFEGDINLDHSIVFRATMVAIRPPKKIKTLSYEVLSSTECSNIGFKPNVYVDIKGFIKKKKEAFKIYDSEVKKYPHPRSLGSIEVLAKMRGIEVVLEYAEAFKLIKDYWI